MEIWIRNFFPNRVDRTIKIISEIACLRTIEQIVLQISVGGAEGALTRALVFENKRVVFRYQGTAERSEKGLAGRSGTTLEDQRVDQGTCVRFCAFEQRERCASEQLPLLSSVECFTIKVVMVLAELF